MLMVIASVNNYPCPPHERSLEITCKNLNREYDAKLDFPEGRKIQMEKNFPWGYSGYFLAQHNYASASPLSLSCDPKLKKLAITTAVYMQLQLLSVKKYL